MPFSFSSLTSRPKKDEPLTYQYEPLDPKKREIRIVYANAWNAATGRVDPRPNVISGLHLSVRTVSLDAKPNFTPISYAWSKGKPLKKVLVDAHVSWQELNSSKKKKKIERYKQTLDIPEDVYDMLKVFVAANVTALKLKAKFPSAGGFWIDQIRINQKDLKEKSSQIGLMDGIYRSSNVTVIWLGLPGEERRSCS
jgi:hypothetical protein